MRKFLTATAAALALGGVTLGAAAPAEARYYHGGYYHHHGGTGAAVAAGIIGLGVGAAIASDHGYYGRGYYGPAYYGPAYYAPPPPPPGYYYGGPPCRTDWRWDGWAHRYVRVSYCY